MNSDDLRGLGFIVGVIGFMRLGIRVRGFGIWVFWDFGL